MAGEERFRIGDYWLSQRRGRAAWCATWYDKAAHQTRRTSLGTTDFLTAQVRLAEWVVEHRGVKHARPPEITLDELLVHYYGEHAQHQRSWQSAKKALGRWAEFFGGDMLSELTLPRQRAFAKWLRDEEGLGAGGVRRTFAVGKAAINYAFESERVTAVPNISMKRLPKGGTRDRVLDLDEAARLFNAVEHEHAMVFLLLAFNTWARHEAILELTRFQVDIRRRLIRLNPPGREQTRKVRPTVPITDTLLPWVREVKSTHLVTWWGQPIKSIRGEFANMCARAGLAGVTPHTIRHTMSTVLRNAPYSVPPWEVQGFLGHRSKEYATTEIYSRWRPSHDGPAALGIDAWFGELAAKIRWDLRDVAGTLAVIRRIEHDNWIRRGSFGGPQAWGKTGEDG